jgi:hypothetical protein
LNPGNAGHLALLFPHCGGWILFMILGETVVAPGAAARLPQFLDKWQDWAAIV